MNRIVVVGAGMVGRGLVGELFSKAGWAVHFLDVDDTLVASLTTAGGYRHSIVGPEAADCWVGHVTASSVHDRPGAVASIAQADLVATSVGQRALPEVAALLADAVGDRTASRPPLNVILCENLHQADRRVRDWVADAGLGPAGLSRLGLVRAAIGRMIPVPVGGSGGPVRVESYGYLPIDPAALLDPPPLPDRVVTDPSVSFDFYEDRKLYVHNLGHFMTAMLGDATGAQFIHQAIDDDFSRYLVRAAMVESAVGVAQHYHVPIGPLLAHVDDLLLRFSNPALGDTVRRVARDPQRKMQPGDRVLGALALCHAEATETTHLDLAYDLGLAAIEGRRVTADDVRAMWIASTRLLGARHLV